MDDRQTEEMNAFKAWQAAVLPNQSFVILKGSPLPPPFTGDWSGLIGSEFEKDLRGADFRLATAQRTDFRDADLRSANLEGANMLAANFEGADMLGARFRDADLRQARFENAKGLTSECFGGAKLQAAILPEDVDGFAEMENIAEISKYIQKMFQFLLILGGFASLTILSIKDEDIILRDGQSMTSLPVLNANITPLNFSFVMPGLIFLVFLYQFIYTVSLWRLLSFMPAFFPDGTPLDRRAYPMVLNTFVRYNLVNVSNETFDLIQCFGRGMIAFGVPPLTLLVFWLSCLRLHERMLSGFHSLLFGVSLGLLLFIFAFSRAILRNEWRLETLKLGHLSGMVESNAAVIATLTLILSIWFLPGSIGMVLCGSILIWLGRLLARNLGKNRLEYSLAHLGCITAIVTVLTGSLSVNCFRSRNHSLKEISLGGGETFPLSREDSFSSTLGFVRFLSWCQSDPFIDIRSRFVSHRPESWTGHPRTEGDEMLAVSGADLESLDLRSMDAERAFLAKANLRWANLEGTYLRFANLREADLSHARLGRAYLRGASFRDANLQGADLVGAIFSIDRDDPTEMIGPNFQGAKIDFRTRLDAVDLIESRVNNLALAYFGETERRAGDDTKVFILKTQLKAQLELMAKRGVPIKTDTELSMGMLIAKKFVGQALSGADFSSFDLTDSSFTCSCFNESDLSGAMFIGANLTRVRFVGANLQGADFTRAILDETAFERCKLEGTIFTDVKAHEVKGLDELTMKLHGLNVDAANEPKKK
jgi:uncharacterized protein YjbI with pentapeptide repeats